MKTLPVLVIAILLAGCGSPEERVSKKIGEFIYDESWQTFDFSNFSIKGWDKLCILGPYTTQEEQDKTIGFHSNLVATDNEGVMTLAFLKNKKVKSYIRHPRNNGDFLKEVGKCFPKEKSSFIKKKSADDGFVYLIHLENK